MLENRSPGEDGAGAGADAALAGSAGYNKSKKHL